MQADSSDLIQRAQQGDQAAFEELYRAQVGRVYALCLRLTADAVRAEELTQDAFVRAWERLASFRGESAFSSWLYRLTVNVVFLSQRASRRRALRVLTTDDPAALERPVDASSTAAGEWDLERAIATLPPGAREVFVLHDVEGYRHHEIAQLTGIAVGTSKAQLFRARRLLRTRALVETHLAGCAGCRAAVAELRALVAGAAALPKRIEPARELWTGVANRIGKRERGKGKGWWRTALAAAAALVIGFAIYRLLPSSPALDGPSGEGWEAVQAEYDEAGAQLRDALASQRDRLEPATVALLQRNLGVIDAAIRESRDALARDPGNVELRGLVASAARAKVELLRWATRVATSS